MRQRVEEEMRLYLRGERLQSRFHDTGFEPASRQLDSAQRLLACIGSLQEIPGGCRDGPRNGHPSGNGQRKQEAACFPLEQIRHHHDGNDAADGDGDEQRERIGMRGRGRLRSTAATSMIVTPTRSWSARSNSANCHDGTSPR